MRHAVSGNRLSRNSSLRKATVRDLAKATLICQKICTTQAKAKEARKLVDKLITLGKRGTLSDKRRAFAILADHQLVSDLFSKTSPRFKQRPGGYTRIIKLGNRRGDNASMAFLELTEKEKIIIAKPKTSAVGKKEKIETIETTAHTHKDTHEHKSTEDSQKPKLKADVKEPVQKDVVKEQPQKIIDKGKTGSKKIIGGIRNMFNRGSSSSGK